ncbi:hypothetical protein HK102_008340, partial [Quaeritorhiza haematococci]
MRSLKLIYEDLDTRLEIGDVHSEDKSSTISFALLKSKLPPYGRFSCWLKPTDGKKSSTLSWMTVVDDDMLSWLLHKWAVDSSHFLIVCRPEGLPSPNTTPVLNNTEASTGSLGEEDQQYQDEPSRIIFKLAETVQKINIAEPLNTAIPSVWKQADDVGETRLKITIMDGSNSLVVDGEGLLEFVKCQVAVGVPLYNIELKTEEGALRLDTDVWLTSLLRNNP